MNASARTSLQGGWTTAGTTVKVFGLGLALAAIFALLGTSTAQAQWRGGRGNPPSGNHGGGNHNGVSHNGGNHNGGNQGGGNHHTGPVGGNTGGYGRFFWRSQRRFFWWSQRRFFGRPQRRFFWVVTTEVLGAATAGVFGWSQRKVLGGHGSVGGGHGGKPPTHDTVEILNGVGNMVGTIVGSSPRLWPLSPSSWRR